ncbi:MAG: YciI family protein [Alphaproteobacteria bacterium]|nr:YciI family protein [Alphaproteobacteria bacterium]
MIFVVLFEDDPARAGARAAHMPDHLAFLERNAARVRAAGPLGDAADGSPAGGMWLVEADARAAVEALVEADPFRPTGLRKSVRILAWNRVFADGKRLI